MNFVVNISSDRRTVIPKNVANEIGLKPGKYNVQYEEGKISMLWKKSKKEE